MRFYMENGADLNLIAICAISEDWSPLTSGLIKPFYLSKEVEAAANWALGLRGTTNWPPSYEAVLFHWPDLDWPDVPSFRGHDPSLWANEVLLLHNKHLLRAGMEKMAEVSRLTLDDPFRADKLKELYRLNTDLLQLPEAGARTTTIGEDVDENVALMMHYGASSTFARLRTGIAPLDAAARPFNSGIYALFGRPKSTKSWTLLEILYNMAVVQGEPVVLVDPENDKGTIMSRLACIHGSLDARELQRARIKAADGEELDQDEEDIIARAISALDDLGETSRIILVGKEHFDPDIGGIPADTIFTQADQHGTKLIFIDQIHKIHVRGGRSGRDRTDASMIKQAVEYCDAQEGYMIWATTQQNRQSAHSEGAKTKMPNTGAHSVFGSDAVAQNVQFLAHVHKWDLPEGDGGLQMLTIELSRGSRPDESRVFLENSFCSRRVLLSEDEGLIRAHECILMEARKSEEAKLSAERRIGDAGTGEKPRAVEIPRPNPRNLMALVPTE